LATDRSGRSLLYAVSGGAVSVSANLGTTFEMRGQVPSAANVLAADPNDLSIVYAGGDGGAPLRSAGRGRSRERTRPAASSGHGHRGSQRRRRRRGVRGHRDAGLQRRARQTAAGGGSLIATSTSGGLSRPRKIAPLTNLLRSGTLRA